MHATGIVVSSATRDEFNSLQDDNDLLFIQYKIQQDTFKATHKERQDKDNNNHGQSREQQLVARMQSVLQDNSPCFIVAALSPPPSASPSSSPSPSPSQRWLFVLFMPDSCSVRERMVYSASASALKDGLGSSLFLPLPWNIRSLSHITIDDLSDSQKVFSHTETMNNDEITAMEAETSSQLAMSSGKMNAIVGLPINAPRETLESIGRVGQQRGLSVILSLDQSTESLLVQEEGSFTYEQLSVKLPTTEPRYIVTNFVYDQEGLSSHAIVFVYYCPDALKAKSKMLYSTCKQVTIRLCTEHGVSVTKSIEISDKSELTSAAVLDALIPPQNKKNQFKKPTRPGKGKARLIQHSDSNNSISDNQAE